MDFDQLQAFLVLSHTKSFSKTAEALHLVQSTVTARIQTLEKSVGRPLFLRNNRRVEITPAGLALLPYAERLLVLREESNQKLKALEIFEDRLTIGSLDSIWKFMLAPVLLDYYSSYPHIALQTKTGHSSDIIQYLMDGIVQIGFVYLKPHLPGVEVIPFFEDDIILVAHPMNKAAQLRGVYPEQLSDLSLVHIDWGSPFEEWMDEHFSPNYLPRIQLDQASLTLSLLKEKAGAALMTRSSVTQEIALGSLVEVPFLGTVRPPKRAAYAIIQKEKRQRPTVQAWFDLMRKQGFFNLD
jgi:LysR family transcriptional repressor of citA